MKILPQVGDFFAVDSDKRVYCVIARRELAKGTKITVLTSDGSSSIKKTTKTLTEIPEGWRILTGEELFEYVSAGAYR